MDDATIRRRIREMLETGTLPCDEPEKVWAGNGLGEFCVACSTAIRHTETEFEVELSPQQTVRLHRRCYDIWREECEPLTTSG